MPIVPEDQRPADGSVPPIDPETLGGTCNRCGNTYDRLYFRGRSAFLPRQRLCVHCVELEATGIHHTGRGGGPRGNDVERPYNQPSPIEMHPGSYDICPWCGNMARPKFGLVGFHFRACGWACAGQWMDWAMEQLLGDKDAERELAEGEAYVRRSLGLIP